MTDALKAGDKVRWHSPQGTITGTIGKKLTAPTDIKGHHVAASEDNPEYQGVSMKRILQLSLIAATLAAPALTAAQSSGYAGPSSSKAAAKGHAGMTNAPLMTAKDLLAKGKDDQYARLQGKLTSHKSGEEYEFTDASGKMTVEIDDDRFPQGVRIDQTTMVELVGEFDKDMIGEPTLDVKQIKVVTPSAPAKR